MMHCESPDDAKVATALGLEPDESHRKRCRVVPQIAHPISLRASVARPVAIPVAISIPIRSTLVT